MPTTTDESNLKRLFSANGKLELLDLYRGQKHFNQPIAAELVKFVVVILFWIGAAFGAGAAVAGITVVLTPLILQNFEIPEWIAQFAVSTAPLAVVLSFIPVNAMFLVLLERKLLALLTTRLGPNRVGFNGLLQTFADALKLLFKEDITPRSSDRLLFFLAPALFFAPSVIAFLPIMSVAGNASGPFAFTQFSTSLLFMLAISSFAIMGLVMAGWASNNKYALIGGLRSTAQAISYEIPLVLSVIAFVIFAGTLDLHQISLLQSGGLLDWNIIAGGSILQIGDLALLFSEGNLGASLAGFVSIGLQALLFPALAFMIYFCSLAEVNRIPFDLPEAESELVSGYNTEFSGMKFALFFLAEYTNLFIASTIFACLFFGGPYLGIPALDDLLAQSLSNLPVMGNVSWLPGALILLIKVYLFVALAIWIRATLPRFRSDQLMGLAWKVLIPASLALVLLSAIARALTLGNYL
ncbi:MAG: complex I subunit 1 family protein [Candidatus Caenarcaniphilales bacterium]|nr:complex I subunit 1 family protein [Candidatus Caenarcaniphilales bacterium]